MRSAGSIDMSTRRIRTLVMSLDYPNRASYYSDWRDAFCNSRDFACHILNILDLKPKRLRSMIEDFEAIVLLHSCNSDTLDYLAPLVPILGNRQRPRLLSFLGNEFNSPYLSNVKRARLLRDARCDLIATQLLREAGEFLYGGIGAEIISIPHALNPDAFRPGPADAGRRIDIGVKGYRYPPFLGDDDRNRMI